MLRWHDSDDMFYFMFVRCCFIRKDYCCFTLAATVLFWSVLRIEKQGGDSTLTIIIKIGIEGITRKEGSSQSSNLLDLSLQSFAGTVEQIVFPCFSLLDTFVYPFPLIITA